MIRTLKRKFITAAMVAVTILLLSLLGALNLVNAWSTRQESLRLLENLVQFETQSPPDFPEGDEPPNPSEEARPFLQLEGERPFRGGEDRDRGFMLGQLTENDRLSAVFFVVRIQDDTVSGTDVSRISTVSEVEAAGMATDAASAGQAAGRVPSFRFASAQTANGETIYVILEVSNRRNAVLRVAALSALAG
ncbi:MAG: hypothetical protein IIY94_09210, partial [Oscillospiraceae bacterium]|nr:hypothetical protein [Oscillospiraceae bacterium]